MKLNEAVKIERYVLLTTEEIIAKLSGVTVFSSLDAASLFWQIPLHPEIRKLNTFITPFGWYSLNVFQKKNVPQKYFNERRRKLYKGLKEHQCICTVYWCMETLWNSMTNSLPRYWR